MGPPLAQPVAVGLAVAVVVGLLPLLRALLPAAAAAVITVGGWRQRRQRRRRGGDL